MQVKKFNNNDEDSSSNEDTIQSPGEKLITKDKIIGQTVNYTSQSFFIDKELKDNLINSKNYDISTHNKNILPMKMKGDFLSLIQQNPKILKQKNPRIQVTNATCDLNQIINNDPNSVKLLGWRYGVFPVNIFSCELDLLFKNLYFLTVL